MAIINKHIIHILRQKVSMLMIAFMLGMSNVILEETRMVNDTKAQTEQMEVMPEDMPDEI